MHKTKTASKIEAVSFGSHPVKVILIIAPSQYWIKNFAGKSRAPVSTISHFETSSETDELPIPSRFGSPSASLGAFLYG